MAESAKTGNYAGALDQLTILLNEMNKNQQVRRRRQSSAECSARTSLVQALKSSCEKLPVNIVQTVNYQCASNLEKACFDLVGCAGPAPACTDVLSKLTKLVAGISTKGVPSLSTVANSVIATAAQEDTKTQILRYTAVRKALQQASNAQLAGAVFDQHPATTVNHSISTISDLLP